jgi:hypothetical protein
LSGVDASTITKIVVKLDGVNDDTTDTGGGDDVYEHDLASYTHLAHLEVRGQGGNDILKVVLRPS